MNVAENSTNSKIQEVDSILDFEEWHSYKY